MRHWRLMSMAAAVAVVCAGLSASPAVAMEPSLEVACPDGIVPVSPTPQRGGAHAEAVDCAAWWGLPDGLRRDGHYELFGRLRRYELVSLLGRLLDISGRQLAGSTADQGFKDVSSQGASADAVNRLASLGVVHGTTPTTFDPGGLVRRDQMASFFVRMHELVYGREFPLGPTFGDTTGSVHESNVRRLVGAGITAGTSATTYDPGGHVTRAQMASFLMRYVDLLVRLGEVEPMAFDALVLDGVGPDQVSAAIPDYSPAILSCMLIVDADDSERGRRFGRAALMQQPSQQSGPSSTACGVNTPNETVVNIHALHSPVPNNTGVAVTISDEVPWRVEVRPLHEAPRLGSRPMEAAGGVVVDASRVAGEVVTVTTRTEEHQMLNVTALDTYGQHLEQFTQQVGAAQFRVPARTRWLQISLDGPWTLAFE
jgi:hypothetical protein